MRGGIAINSPKSLPLIGGVVAAVAASSCCILPLFLGAASAGSIGLSAALAPYRPYFIALTVLMLGSAFYATYRPRQSDCCTAAKPAPAHQLNKVILWGVAIFTLASLIYPDFAAIRARQVAPAPRAIVAPTGTTAVFAIGNMNCAECTLPIVKALRDTPGVYDAAVNFPAKQATVCFDSARIDEGRLRAIIEKTGFTVR